MILMVVVFQGLIFIGLIFVLRQFMKGHLSGAMGHLQKLNDDLLKQQAEFREKTAAAEKEYDMKLARLQQDIAEQQQKNKDEAIKALEDSKARAMAEREKIINEAVETREKMRKEIMAEMEEKAIQHSKAVVGEALKGDLLHLVHEYLVTQVLDGIKNAPVENFQIKTGHALLSSAEPLKPEVKERIQKALKEKIKTDVEFKEEIDPLLVAGFVLKFGTLVLDGSLANRLSESAARLKKETIRRYQATI